MGNLLFWPSQIRQIKGNLLYIICLNQKKSKHNNENELNYNSKIWKANFSDNSYYCWNDNFQKESTYISFELDTFHNKVVYPRDKESSDNDTKRRSSVSFTIDNMGN